MSRRRPLRDAANHASYTLGTVDELLEDLYDEGLEVEFEVDSTKIPIVERVMRRLFPEATEEELKLPIPLIVKVKLGNK